MSQSLTPLMDVNFVDKYKSQQLQSNVHPLLHDLIVRKIFQYFSLNDILECRAVCQSWYVVGTKLLMSRIDDIIIEPPLSKTYGTAIINYFLSMVNKSSLSFTNFSFVNFPMGCSEINQLFNACGPAIKKIKLRGVTITSSELSDLLINKLPNLEELHLLNLPKDVKKNAIFSNADTRPELKLKSIRLDQWYFEPSYCRDFLRDLFSLSNNLEHLTIKTNFDSEYVEHAIIETLVTEGTIQNLKELKISSVNDELMSLLGTHFKSVPLRKFTLEHESPFGVTSNLIKTFIDRHQDTWEHLQLGITERMSIEFPEMKKLKYFSLGTYYPLLDEGNETPDFEILNYAKFPNLVTLKLFDVGSRYGNRRLFDLNKLLPQTATPLLSVKNLELPPELNRGILLQIGKIFPNVLKLSLPFQQLEVFSELWTTWPLIRSLSVSLFVPGSKFTKKTTNISFDSILTGFSDNSLDLWYKSKGEIDIDSFPVGPSMGDLTHLRHLLIIDGPRLGEHESWQPPSKITDATATLALLKMKQLVCVHISKAIHKFSQLCVTNLCSKLDLLDTNNPFAIRLQKYEWQRKLHPLDLDLYQSFPEYV